MLRCENGCVGCGKEREEEEGFFFQAEDGKRDKGM